MAVSVMIAGAAGRYATALFALADERKALDSVAEDFYRLKSWIAENADLRLFLRSTLITREEGWRALNTLMDQAKFNPLTYNFVGLVCEKRRLPALPAMIDAYLAKRAQHQGEIEAEIWVAKRLSEAQEKALVEALKHGVGSGINVSIKLAPNLLGGLIVKIGSRMIDNSVSGGLDRLRAQLKGDG